MECSPEEYIDGYGSEPHLKIPIRFTRSYLYLDWVNSFLEYKVYMYLQSYIVRGKSYKSRLITELYNSYYLNGKLAARWGLNQLANFFNTQKSSISRVLTNLEKKGFIKKDVVILYGKRINVYILGIHFNDIHPNTEYLFAHLGFTRAIAEQTLHRFETEATEVFEILPETFLKYIEESVEKLEKTNKELGGVNMYVNP